MSDHVSSKLGNSTEGSSNTQLVSDHQTRSGSEANNRIYNILDAVKRAYILILGLAAVAFSIAVVYSCEFFSYRTLDGQPWEELMPPFDSLSAATVGLFSFSATVKEGQIELSFLDGECIEYDNPWETGQSDYWIIAQWCAIAAPIAGFLAWIQLILEMIFCRLRCSFLLIPLLLLVASGLQGCSFMIFADREFCFNAASQNQCRLDSGAWFSMAACVSYLILCILCTSIDPYNGINTRFLFFVGTKDCRRTRSRKICGDIESEVEHKLHAETSISSGDGRNWRDIVEDDDEDDFGQSNVAAVDSNFSGLNGKSSEESKDEEEETQASSTFQSPGTGTGLISDSLETENNPTLTQSESDVLLNKNDDDNILAEKQIVPAAYKHSFPRKPDFLDMCCAGDPLEVEKHLEYPVKLLKSKKGSL